MAGKSVVLLPQSGAAAPKATTASLLARATLSCSAGSSPWLNGPCRCGAPVIAVQCMTPMHVQVTDGTRSVRIRNGSAMLTKITAAGCSLTALIAALCAVMPDDPLVATVHGLAYFGCAPAPIPRAGLCCGCL